MAQLKQDEWPNDHEPTTSEVEGDAFKSEHPRRPIEQPRCSDRNVPASVPPAGSDVDADRDRC
jgi:hypothetical protein